MPVSRRDVIKTVSLAGAGVLLSRCGTESPAPRRPNIIYVMTDDQTIDQMSCYGSTLIRTPNMDRLAAEGVRFTRSYVTNSLCAPSRATVLTGCYSHVHGIRGNSEGREIEVLDPNLPTFSRLLQQAGYRTAIVGKWHLPQAPVGFDYSCILPGQGRYVDPDFIENGERKTFKGHATDLTTDFALGFLKTTTPDQPFLLIYQHKAPHRPFTPPERLANLLADVEVPYPETFDDDYATRRIAAEAEDMKFEVSLAGDYPDLPPDLSPAERRKWIFQRFVKDHYRGVVGVDENLGRVLDHLDQNGLSDDTLIMYTSDNGFYLGEHGWYDKRFMYEPSLSVPLLVRYPRLIPGGRVEDRMVLNIDYAPTILDFAGVPIPSQMQGESLRPMLEGRPTPEWRQSIYYSYFENSWELRHLKQEELSDPSFQYFTPHRIGPHRGVRTGRYKLIEYYSEGDYWEFFDLQQDPHELRNRYAEPQYATAIEEHKRELRRLQAQYNDFGVAARTAAAPAPAAAG
jgi:arylsulfatase A-like enzyme